MLSSRIKIALAAALFVSCAPRAHAQTGVGRITAHDHSSLLKGGSTLAPQILLMPVGSTATIPNAVISTQSVSSSTVVNETVTGTLTATLTGNASSASTATKVGAGGVDFSTITTALAGKAPLTGGGTSGTWPISITGTASATTLPTRQVFLSGSGTYTTPANARQLRVRMVGGGAGGAGYLDTASTPGGNSSFNSIVAAGGGATGTLGTWGGGLGGTGGTGSASVRTPGGAGGSTSSAQAVTGYGGNSGCGGGGAYGVYSVGQGINALVNSGGGGSGGYNGGAAIGGGGGGGECVEYIINSPAATYPIAVGAGGAGSNTGGSQGGTGGSGIVVVDEYY